MKTNIFFIPQILAFCFLFSTILPAQEQFIDSLETVLKQTKDDSIKFAILTTLANKTIKTNAQKSIGYILQGTRLAEKKQSYKHLSGFHSLHSQYLSVTNTLDSAIILIKKAASYLPHLKGARYHIGVRVDYARLLKEKGDIPAATEQYLEILKTSEKENFSEGVVSAYIGLSGLFASQKMYTEAIEYNQKCKGICDSLRPHRAPYCRGIIYGNLAAFYLAQKQVDSSLVYGLKSIAIKEKTKNIREIYLSYNIVARAYLRKKDTVNALQFYEKSLTTAKKMNDILGTSRTLLQMGKIDINRKKTSSVEKIFLQLDSLMPKVQNPLVWVDYYNIKKGFLQLKKDYKGALALFRKQYQMVDSLRKESNATLVASLETKYETEKHKVEKELAEKELLISNAEATQNKRNFIGVTIFSVLIFLLLLYILSRLNIIRQQKIALNEAYTQLEQQKQNEVALLNLKALQAQMNPHFIFNALNSIQDLVLMKDIKNSTIYLGKFSTLIRKILLSSKEQFISLENELNILQLYLDLEKLRFGNQFEISFNCEIPAAKQLEIQLPAMFIQPYIENAIKHGLFHKKGLKKLFVEFSLSDNFLQCIIEDNGIGQEKANEMKIKTLHLHTGFSTEAIQHRIKFLNQTMNKKITVKTEDLIQDQKPTGTRVTLRFSMK